jgi:hypothetical protein
MMRMKRNPLMAKTLVISHDTCTVLRARYITPCRRLVFSKEIVGGPQVILFDGCVFEKRGQGWYGSITICPEPYNGFTNYSGGELELTKCGGFMEIGCEFHNVIYKFSLEILDEMAQSIMELLHEGRHNRKWLFPRKPEEISWY